MNYSVSPATIRDSSEAIVIEPGDARKYTKINADLPERPLGAACSGHTGFLRLADDRAVALRYNHATINQGRAESSAGSVCLESISDPLGPRIGGGDSMSDVFELEEQESEPSKPGRQPAQPLPRLWRTEPETPDDEIGPAGSDPPPQKPRKTDEAVVSKATGKPKTPKGKAKVSKGKGASVAGDNTEKKVLIEDTPALDTYESRRRVRWIVGGLSVACAFLMGWIFYRTFIYDASPIQVTVEDPSIAPGGPDGRPSLDQEARFMFNRAHDHAKKNQFEQAIGMLEQIIKVYKGTQTAKDAQAALDRPKKNLPMFSDSPVVVAEPTEAPKNPEPAPLVVAATPDRGQVTKGQADLVLPANPAEVLVAPPGAPPGNGAAKGAVPVRTVPPDFKRTSTRASTNRAGRE